MDNYPTPDGTPTQIYIRFGEEKDGAIECHIGTDGEDKAPHNTRMTMVAILQGIAVTLAVLQNMDGAEAANQIASAILKQGGQDAQ